MEMSHGSMPGTVKHSLHGQVAHDQFVKPPSETETIEIGDFVGLVEWCSSEGAMIWLRYRNCMADIDIDDDEDFVPPLLPIPSSQVQRTHLPPTVKFNKERGYDLRPGDFVSVARGPQYMALGVVQSVDFVSTRLQFVSDSDQSLIDVPIRFVIKIRNAGFDTFKKVIGKEVYIIGGYRKGYRATLYNIRADSCTVAVHSEHGITVKLAGIATRTSLKRPRPAEPEPSSPLAHSPTSVPSSLVISGSLDPTKFLHPSHLSTADLTDKTFQSYIRHFLSNAAPKVPTPPTGPTGLTLSHLHRIPELALLASLVVSAETKCRD
ncbi:hypothetical protein DEU56DRAFT_916680 [Suillus clintonianus]|uniref:uncharacterized protein n=1 Tax=Suillus clintonianus TaxID=1904413 RepID=UPI001B861581|nr:uncharacterized protein DEU56DRAFT_916680 [Suillus clintonianus]KAG2125176.1 hypothetical protein DEU56DRAFT_916680 [Suillus clintonianus]